MDDGSVRWIKLPADELTESRCTHANQIATGIYETDSWTSPRGRTISRRFSCWDDGRGCQQGDYYVEVIDDADRNPVIDETADLSVS